MTMAASSTSSSMSGLPTWLAPRRWWQGAKAWFQYRADECVDYWHTLSQTVQWTVCITASVAVALLAAGFVAVPVYNSFNAPSQPAALAAMPAPAIVEPGRVIASDDAVKFQLGIKKLINAYQQHDTRLVEDRMAINANREEIKAVKKDVVEVKEYIKSNPAAMKDLDEDLKRLDQIMSKPLVPIVPIS